MSAADNFCILSKPFSINEVRERMDQVAEISGLKECEKELLK